MNPTGACVNVKNAPHPEVSVIDFASKLLIEKFSVCLICSVI